MVAVSIAAAGCLVGASPAAAQSPAPTITSDGLSLVGLGDSLPGALGCVDPCRSFVEIYGELAAVSMGMPVTITNLATNDSLESSGLLARVQTAPYTARRWLTQTSSP